MPYRQKAEAFWKMAPEVEAARHLPGWRDFDIACARRRLLFDHIERVPGRKEWECVAHTSIRGERSGQFKFLAEGRGRTPVAALLDAYAKSGIDVPEAAPFLALLRGEGARADPIDLEGILG